MCGLAGFSSSGEVRGNTGMYAIQAMTAALIHLGSDSEGCCADEPAG